MSQLIAGVYEIEHKIGAGGGGVVYLGRHTRLNKLVVMKADKRTLSVGTEKLRREVDMLKDLSQTYIPQVYDFVQEDGIVYTVMDYIEGESLDKMLGRHEKASQPDLVKWACQLLEALAYLHNRPPYGILHGDIKPANIMLRPNGDICLIDFNIALALGEDGAVKVGFSRGYASPEHYGADYISANRPAAVGPVKMTSVAEADDKTLVEDDDKTEVDDVTMVEFKSQPSIPIPSTVGSITRSQEGILLDARSDIYSLGATLYHLISGKRPSEDAREVEPLGPDICSPAVAAVIKKSMEPMPEERYQTAEEMLLAFRSLHANDIRTIRHKRRMVASAVVLAIIFLAGGSSTFIGMNRMEQIQEAKTLAEYSANALAKGDVALAVEQAMAAIPDSSNILEGEVTAQAQKALVEALGVYKLSDGFHALNSVELPAAPFHVEMSPQGTRMAVVYGYEVTVIDLLNQERLVTMPIQNSALSDAVFVDENTLIYAGDKGVTAIDVTTAKILWTGEEATTLSLSMDGTKLATVNRNAEYACIYQTSDGKKLCERSFNGLHMQVAVNDIFADADNDIFALNQDGSLLAVSFMDGSLVVLDIENPANDLIIYEGSDYKRFTGGFYENYFAFSAEKSGEAILGLVETKEAVYVGGYTSDNRILVKTNSQGIYVANGNLLVQLDMETLQEHELAYTGDVNITNYAVCDKYSLVATEDNCFAFYDKGARLTAKEAITENGDFLVMDGEYAAVANRSETSVRLLHLESHVDTQLLSYDARYVHDEARVSADGQRVMLFNYESYQIYDMQGNLITEDRFPDTASIYDQQFRKDTGGSYLEVIWYDGTRRYYSAADGSLMREEKGEIPSKDLYEEFFTDKYKITSSLHGAPEVYDISTNELITILESDDYLTYVSQMGEYLVTEYISTSDARYGLLLDRNLEVVAQLPNLCDVFGENFVFDYKSGDLRQISMYSLEELVELGRKFGD